MSKHWDCMTSFIINDPIYFKLNKKAQQKVMLTDKLHNSRQSLQMTQRNYSLNSIHNAFVRKRNNMFNEHNETTSRNCFNNIDTYSLNKKCKATGMKQMVKSKSCVYDKIFPKIIKQKDRNILIDNKLNLVYSENEAKFAQNLQNLQDLNKNKNKNKGINAKLYSSRKKYVDSTISKINEKLNYVKRITDYCFPTIFIIKLGEVKKRHKNASQKKGPRHYYPYDEINQANNKMTEQRNLLRETFVVQNKAYMSQSLTTKIY